MNEPLSKTELGYLMENQMRSYSGMLSALANVECTAKEKRTQKGCFDFIGHPLPPVANSISLAVKYLKEDKKHPIYYPKFLDCGCGYGNIMLLAYSLNCSAYGIDLNERALKLARLSNYKNNPTEGSKHWVVYRRDILTYRDYSKYDILYYYCPMQNGKLEQKFEHKLADDMRIGAIVLPFYSTATFTKDERFTHLGDFVGKDNKYRYGLIMIKTKK